MPESSTVQDTIVVRLDTAERERLKERLRGGSFEYRSVPHAVFSARGEGVVATLYRSGKLVVQGADAAIFAARYLDRQPASSAPTPGVPGVPEDVTLVGGDESGKGDWFGPLVVAAVRVEPEDAEKLREGGVMDSKKLSDARVFQLAPALRQHFPHAIERLAPRDYNAAHARLRNVNLVLSELYARAVGALAEPGMAVLIDQFSKRADRLEEALGGLGVELYQAPRAERNAAVAAASVIAREAFLLELARASDEYGVDLAKGAGPPADDAGRRFAELHGVEKLGEVCKLHFANTNKLRAARP